MHLLTWIIHENHFAIGMSSYQRGNSDLIFWKLLYSRNLEQTQTNTNILTNIGPSGERVKNTKKYYPKFEKNDIFTVCFKFVELFKCYKFVQIYFCYLHWKILVALIFGDSVCPIFFTSLKWTICNCLNTFFR